MKKVLCIVFSISILISAIIVATVSFKTDFSYKKPGWADGYVSETFNSTTYYDSNKRNFVKVYSKTSFKTCSPLELMDNNPDSVDYYGSNFTEQLVEDLESQGSSDCKSDYLSNVKITGRYYSIYREVTINGKNADGNPLNIEVISSTYITKRNIIEITCYLSKPDEKMKNDFIESLDTLEINEKLYNYTHLVQYPAKEDNNNESGVSNNVISYRNDVCNFTIPSWVETCKGYNDIDENVFYGENPNNSIGISISENKLFGDYENDEVYEKFLETFRQRNSQEACEVVSSDLIDSELIKPNYKVRRYKISSSIKNKNKTTDCTTYFYDIHTGYHNIKISITSENGDESAEVMETVKEFEKSLKVNDGIFSTGEREGLYNPLFELVSTIGVVVVLIAISAFLLNLAFRKRSIIIPEIKAVKENPVTFAPKKTQPAKHINKKGNYAVVSGHKFDEISKMYTYQLDLFTGYGWDIMLNTASFVCARDLINVTYIATAPIAGAPFKDHIEELYEAKTFSGMKSLQYESGALRIGSQGSKYLGAPVMIEYYNQLSFIRLYTFTDDSQKVQDYVNKMIGDYIEAISDPSPDSKETEYED